MKNLKHLSLYRDAIWDSITWNKASPEMLIWNSRSTMRSIELNESIFHNMRFQWEKSGDEPPRQGYLSALKSFSLIGGEFDDEETDAIIQAIDFIKLEELKLGRGNTGTGLLYRRLLNAFSTARKGVIKLRSLHMNLAVDPEDGIEFLASFGTLTRLTIFDSDLHVGDSQDYSLDDYFLRGLFMHKNLTTFKLTDKNHNLERDIKLALDAQIVTKFLVNLPHLRHLHFYFDERQLVRHFSFVDRAILTFDRDRLLKHSPMERTWRRYVQRRTHGPSPLKRDKMLHVTSSTVWPDQYWNVGPTMRIFDGKTTVRSSMWSATESNLRLGPGLKRLRGLRRLRRLRVHGMASVRCFIDMCLGILLQ